MATHAQPRIFSIPELFETVLFHLPLRNLLLVQSVCRQWKKTIDDSPALQQKLFFRPVPDRTQEPEFNPLLQEMFSPLFRLDGHKYNGHSAWDICEAVDWFKDEGRRQKVLRPEASWRRMFPVQPPARIEHMVSAGGCGCYYETMNGVIPDHFQHLQERGTSMGLLWEVAVHMLDKNARTNVWIRWHMFPWVPVIGDGEDDQHLEGMEEPPRNEISVHVWWSSECYEKPGAPCGLSVGFFDDDIIAWIEVE